MKTKTIFILIAIAAVAYYLFFNKDTNQSRDQQSQSLNEDIPTGQPVIPVQPIVVNPQPMPGNREPVTNMRVGANSSISLLNQIN